MGLLYEKLGQIISAHVALFALGAVIAGVSLPDIVHHLNPFVVALFAFMTFQSSLSNKGRHVIDAFRHPQLLLVVLLCSTVIMPVLAFGLTSLLFGGSPYIVTGTVLEYSVPIAVTSIMWITMFGGNGPVALACVLVCVLISPFTIPLTLKLLVGASVHVDVFGMFTQMIIMIALPSLVGVLLNDFSHGWAARVLAPELAPAARIAMVLIIMSNSTNIAPFVRNLTPQLVLVALYIGGFIVFCYCFGMAVGHLLHKDVPTTISLTYLIGMRNISSGAVIAAQFFPPEVMFPVIIGTLFQQVIAAFVGTFFKKTHGQNQLQEVQNSHS